MTYYREVAKSIGKEDLEKGGEARLLAVRTQSVLRKRSVKNSVDRKGREETQDKGAEGRKEGTPTWFFGRRPQTPCAFLPPLRRYRDAWAFFKAKPFVLRPSISVLLTSIRL